LVLRGTDDGVLGAYDFFLGANVAAITIAGCIALSRQVRALQSPAGQKPGRARSRVLCRLALSLRVGGRASWYLRPFFGARDARRPAALPPRSAARSARSHKLLRGPVAGAGARAAASDGAAGRIG